MTGASQLLATSETALLVAARQAVTILSTQCAPATIAQAAELLRTALAIYPESVAAAAPGNAGEFHKLDTSSHVFFYEQDFYVLSNFSSFSVYWKGGRFDTSEAAYHWEKFPNWPQIRSAIAGAFSAHDAYKVAEQNKQLRRADWGEVKVGVMKDILRAKVDQHEYVRRKLLATGDRILVEDSWRDDYWGWGPSRDGQNMLGMLWMEIRAELRRETSGSGSAAHDNNLARRRGA